MIRANFFNVSGVSEGRPFNPLSVDEISRPVTALSDFRAPLAIYTVEAERHPIPEGF
jgi:hypothetical protein